MTAPLPELTPEYMRTMYPQSLELVQAQVFFRHGERSPVKTQLFPKQEWPFCTQSNYLHSEFMKAIGRFVPKTEPMPLPDAHRMMKGDNESSSSQYTQRTKTMKTGLEYEPAKWSVRLGSSGMDSGDKSDNNSSDPRMCNAGQLTDVGLQSLERVGKHLRELYIDRLGIIPASTGSKVSDFLYIRSTDYSRVLQSTFALLTGLYPSKDHAVFDGAFLARFPIHTRLHKKETMHGNFACYNFIKHYMDPLPAEARRLKWIDDVYRQTAGLASIGSKAKQIMDTPQFGSSFHPVYDELQSLTAHGVRLPSDISADLLASLGRVAYYQWTKVIHTVQGQRLGFGRLLGDITQTMSQAVAHSRKEAAGGGSQPQLPPYLGAQRKYDLLVSADGGIREETPDEIPRVPKLALYGGHDITIGPLAIIMGSKSPDWLPFASALTFEVFRDKSASVDGQYYVRTRLDDKTLQVVTCEPTGKHHPHMGSSMCTLEAFFEHVRPLIAAEGEFKIECGTFPSPE